MPGMVSSLENIQQREIYNVEETGLRHLSEEQKRKDMRKLQLSLIWGCFVRDIWLSGMNDVCHGVDLAKWKHGVMPSADEDAA